MSSFARQTNANGTFVRGANDDFHKLNELGHYYSTGTLSAGLRGRGSACLGLRPSSCDRVGTVHPIRASIGTPETDRRDCTVNVVSNGSSPIVAMCWSSVILPNGGGPSRRRMFNREARIAKRP